MKKLFLTVLAALVSVAAIAGNGRWGVTAGLTSTATHLTEALSDVRAGSVNLYHAGISWNKPIALGFRLQPGIQYNVKGASFNELNMKTGYLEIPVQLQWSPVNILNLVTPYVFGEPFIGCAMGNAIDGETINEKWECLKTRMEYGFSLGLGCDIINHLQVSVKYFWNIGQLYEFSFEDAKDTVVGGRCSGIGASLSFFF